MTYALVVSILVWGGVQNIQGGQATLIDGLSYRDCLDLRADLHRADIVTNPNLRWTISIDYVCQPTKAP